MSDDDREAGFYWIKPQWVNRWEPGEWQPGGWVEGAAGIWGCIQTEIPIYELADLAAVTVGARIEAPHE